MMMKDKLYKHNFSSTYFKVRKFFAIFGIVCGVGLIIAIPTYISLNSQNQNQSAKADDDSGKNGNELLSYQQNEDN